MTKQNDKAIEVLRRAPVYLLEELGRDPDAAALQQDARFQNLLRTKNQ